MDVKSNKLWFIYINNHEEGPFPTSSILEKIQSGVLKANDYVWTHGLDQWKKIHNFDELAGPSGIQKPEMKTASFSLKIQPEASKVIKTKTLNAALGEGQTHSGVNTGQVKANSVSLSNKDSRFESNDRIWTLNANGMHSGPYSAQDIGRKIDIGEINVQDYVWREGWTTWKAILTVEGLVDLIQASDKTSKRAESTGMTSTNANLAHAREKTQLTKSTSIRNREFTNQTNSRELLTARKKTSLSSVFIYIMSAIFLGILSFAGVLVYFDVIPVAHYFVSIPEIPNLPETDLLKLSTAAKTPLSEGPRIAFLKDPTDETKPTLLFATNLPDGMSFDIELKGRKGTLVGMLDFSTKLRHQTYKHFAKIPLSSDSKSLPHGEYDIIITDSKDQIASIANKVKKMQKVKFQDIKDKVVFEKVKLFLPTPKDAQYKIKLQEYLQSISAELTAELNDIETFTNYGDKTISQFREILLKLKNAKNLQDKNLVWAKVKKPLEDNVNAIVEITNKYSTEDSFQKATFQSEIIKVKTAALEYSKLLNSFSNFVQTQDDNEIRNREYEEGITTSISEMAKTLSEISDELNKAKKANAEILNSKK